MIKIVKGKKEELYKEVSKIYIEKLIENPKLNLGMATGSSPIKLYELLIEAYERGEVSFKDVQTFNLDEYCGLDKNDINSYHSFMNKNLFSSIDINLSNTHFPSTVESEIEMYDELLANNPIDIQVLGIGSNGHIAFNEPGSSFDSRTRIVDLAQKTIEDNARFFDDINDVPTKAVSMGLGTIMEAKKIILIAIGDAKADVLKEIFKDDNISEDIPATILKKHPDVTFYIDDEAGKYL